MAYSIKLPGKYVQGAGELKNLGLNVKKLGNKFFVLCTPSNRKRVGAAIEESLKSVEKDYAFCDFSGACTKAEIARVMEEYQASGCDAVIGGFPDVSRQYQRDSYPFCYANTGF